MKNINVILFLIFIISTTYVIGQESSKSTSSTDFYTTSKIAAEPANDNSQQHFFVAPANPHLKVKDLDERRVADIVKKIDGLRLQLNILCKYAGSKEVFIENTLPRINKQIKIKAPNCPMDVFDRDLYREDVVHWINEMPNEYLKVFKYLKREVEKEK